MSEKTSDLYTLARFPTIGNPEKHAGRAGFVSGIIGGFAYVETRPDPGQIIEDQVNSLTSKLQPFAVVKKATQEAPLLERKIVMNFLNSQVQHTKKQIQALEAKKVTPIHDSNTSIGEIFGAAGVGAFVFAAMVYSIRYHLQARKRKKLTQEEVSRGISELEDHLRRRSQHQ